MLEEWPPERVRSARPAFDRARRFVAAHEALEEQLIQPGVQRQLNDLEVFR